MKQQWLSYSLVTACSLAGVQCGSNNQEQTDSSHLQREWDSENAPQRMGLLDYSFKVDLASLPSKGSLSTTPWSGGYWPTYLGGIAYRWNHPSQSDNDRVFYNTKPQDQLTHRDILALSPAEKYDLLLGDASYSLTRAERERTDVMSRLNGGEIPRWFGLCHAWAPATLLFNNPKPVVVQAADGRRIPFGSADIKGLLTMYLHETQSNTYFVSRRCNVDDKALRKKLDHGEISRAEYDAIMNSAECQGINAGAFHVILANMLAIRNQGFIVDITRGGEVWNQPVHSFSSHIELERSSNISPEAAPGTAKEVLVHTNMTYTQEIDDGWNRIVVPYSNKTVQYDYWLELNAQGAIIGGHWVSEEQPDFAWRKEAPTPLFTGKWAGLGQIMARQAQVGDEGDIIENDPYLEEGPQWKFRNLFLAYSVKLNLKTSSEVASVKMQIVKKNGKLGKSHTMKHSDVKGFHKKIFVTRWKKKSVRVTGYNTAGKELFQFTQSLK